MLIARLDDEGPETIRECAAGAPLHALILPSGVGGTPRARAVVAGSASFLQGSQQDKTKDDPKDWDALITLCKTFNETSLDELEAALEPILHVDGALWILALENALVNGDGYCQGAALDVTYRARLRPESSATTLVEDLNRLDGIASVELRRADWRIAPPPPGNHAHRLALPGAPSKPCERVAPQEGFKPRLLEVVVVSEGSAEATLAHHDE